MLQSIQLEDILGEKDQMNFPGTTTEQPNWRRKLSESIEEIAKNQFVQKFCSDVSEARK